MSASYQSISWNHQKKKYDRVIAAFVVLYLALFISFTLLFYPEVTQETLILRSTATLAILLLHIILSLGPLARLNPIFLPLLYNRRHLGVTMFFISAIHGIFAIIQFHSLGNINPILSIFISNTHFESFTRFPFQVLGFIALVILFLMAITSHDFWLRNLGPKIWKALHVQVYVAYVLIVLHVLLGALQYETSPVLPLMLALGIVILTSLHLMSGEIEKEIDSRGFTSVKGLVKVCHVDEIVNNRAKIVNAGDERIAVFKYDNRVSAISNVCKHQNGPLGEGMIIDGCVTCPWHGYQYLPHNGSSPPPFKEKVSTFDVKIINGEIWINPQPYPDGTERPAAIIESSSSK